MQLPKSPRATQMLTTLLSCPWTKRPSPTPIRPLYRYRPPTYRHLSTLVHINRGTMSLDATRCTSRCLQDTDLYMRTFYIFYNTLMFYRLCHFATYALHLLQMYTLFIIYKALFLFFVVCDNDKFSYSTYPFR